MRRFQSSTMGSKLKSYEMVGRPSVTSSGPRVSANSNVPRLAKLFAAITAALTIMYIIHTVTSPTAHVYGLMIDAGSTGSRIHTFTFLRHPKTGQLRVLSEDFYALKPGLSSYKGSPENASASLEPLLSRARSRVPISMHKSTPVVLRATAGLRMLGVEASGEILVSVREKLRSSGFRFDDDAWASILAGNEEAVFSWMTVNYLMGRTPSHTVGTLEMGGGSAQVAYVPRDSSKSATGNCSLASEQLKFGGTDLNLYTVSHLNFGLEKARAEILKKFESAAKLSDNPCFNAGEEVTVKIPFEETESKLTISGSGDYAKCRELIATSLINPAMGESCACDVCTYKAAAQPIAIDEYVAFAFYLERTVAVGLTSPMGVEDIDRKGNEICQMSVQKARTAFPAVPNGAATDLCMDLAYISLHLERGHGIKPNSGTRLTVVDKINDFELGWCLGAMQQTMAELQPLN